MAEFKPLARKNEIVVQEVEGETLIYDLKANKAFNLNETSSIVWQLCDGDKTITEIAENLSNKYNSPITDDFVWLAPEPRARFLDLITATCSRFPEFPQKSLIRK